MFNFRILRWSARTASLADAAGIGAGGWGFESVLAGLRDQSSPLSSESTSNVAELRGSSLHREGASGAGIL
jgi:hypothetical protein